MTDISEKQRAHARRNALQDAKKHAYTAEVLKRHGKPPAWSPDRVQDHAEYVANLIGPKREPARSQWKEHYAHHFTTYMTNSGHMKREEEPAPPAPKVQVTKDGPAYLLPGIEPVGKQKGEATQTALF